MLNAKNAESALSIYVVSTLVSMAVMSLGLVGVGFALACAVAMRRKGLFDGLREKPLFSASLALAAACLLSLLAAMVWPLEYGGQHAEVSLGRDMAKAWYLFLPFLLLPALRLIGTEGAWKVVRVWVCAAAVLGAIGIVQHFTGWPRPQVIPGPDGGPTSRFHATLFLGHHLSVANILVFPWFVTWDLALSREGSKKLGLPRGLLIAASVLGLGLLFATYSRITWVALPIGLALWAIWTLPRKTALGAGALLALGIVLALQVPQVRDRVSASLGHGDRWALWSANWEFFKARPLTGTGWHHNLKTAEHYFRASGVGENFFVGHAHNVYLEALASTGLVGFVAWLAWVWIAVAIWVRVYRGVRAVGRSDGGAVQSLARGVLCAWAVFLIQGLTQVNFWETKVLHQIMWVTALGLCFVEKKRPR